MKTETTYQCEICERQFSTAEEALACENRTPDPHLAEVGDIVFVRSGFGWFDGDVAWVSNPQVREVKERGELGKKIGRCPKGDSNCFADCCTFKFYYVVTAIDRDSNDHYPNGHRVRYHVMTKAMTGEQGYRGGYTFNIHHRTPVKVENPPAKVVEDSKDLIGKKAKGLI